MGTCSDVDTYSTLDIGNNNCFRCGIHNKSLKEDQMTTEQSERLARCKCCESSYFEDTASDNEYGYELYCKMHGYPCDMIIQCKKATSCDTSLEFKDEHLLRRLLQVAEVFLNDYRGDDIRTLRGKLLDANVLHERNK